MKDQNDCNEQKHDRLSGWGHTVSLSLLEPKQKPRNQRSMDPINIHIGQLKTAFT